MREMRAAILTGQNEPLVVETVTLADPNPGEVMVRLVASGICHSDLHAAKGELIQPLPLVLGHEGAGIIEMVGEGVTGVKPGQRVVLSWIPACGTCGYCQAGQGHLCANGDPMAKQSRITWKGQPVNHFLSTSAFAEYAVVPEGGVVAIADDIPLETAALVSCGVATGIGAVRYAARIQPGQTVAVFGCGGVGLNVIQGARLAGASRIIGLDRVAAKLELAEKFGATDTLDVTDLNVKQALRDLTGGLGVDAAFDAVGQVSVIETALGGVRKGGQVIMVGLPPVDQFLNVRALLLVLQEKSLISTLYGSLSPHQHIPQLLDLYRAGELMLDELVSHHFPLEEINAALAALERGELTRGIITLGADN